MRIRQIFSAGNSTSLFLAFFIFAAAAFGQTPTPIPNDETIRVNTDLIQTSVRVVDKKNRFVEGLKKEQFELRVDDKPVPITFFDQVVSVRTNVNSPTQSDSPSLAATDGNPALLRDRKVIFFVDDLHLSLDSINRTRQAITHFIDDEMMPRDSVLIISASGQIGFLQQFTDNKAVLRAAVARLKFIPFATRDTELPPMPEFTALRILNGDKEVADYYVEQIFKGFNPKGLERGINYAGALEMVRNRANNIVSALVSVSESSLGSLENLLRVLNQTGGRKLVFFASDGFYLGSKNNSPVDNVRLQRVVDLATRSGSVLYTIDARGLFTVEADATGDRPIDEKGRFDRGKVSEEMLSQEALFSLAEQTGGKFLKNQNYFDKWVDKTLDENANYYVLAWTPEKEASADRKFRRVEVSVVGRPDLTVRLQRGFLTGADKIEAKNKENKKRNSNKKSAESVAPTTVAIAPPQTSAKKPLPVSLALKYLDVPNVGGVLTSSVQVETAGLDYSGKQSAAIDVAGVVFNEQGKQVADFKTGLNIASLQSDKEQSVIYNNRTPLAPGLYQVKVGARETKSGQTGTATEWIEIPDLAKKQLTIGSLLLGIKSIKKSDKPEDVQIQFSVDNQFSHPLQLDFMSFIYNAAQSASDGINLTTKIEIIDSQGRLIVNTPPRPLITKGIEDLSRIPFTATIRQQTSVPGSYLLRVTVNDLTAKTSAVGQAVFTIE
ncbi:MAG: VWA domain-containing protein [Pyrinomonadaceae bacterium]